MVLAVEEHTPLLPVTVVAEAAEAEDMDLQLLLSEQQEQRVVS